MCKKLMVFILLSPLIPLTAQQDSKAGEILDNLVQYIKSSPSWNIKFDYIIEDIKEETAYEQHGELLFKEDKYILTLLDTKVYYNGEIMWNYLVDANEVNITIPEENETDLFFTDPEKIFTIYKEDYKYKYSGMKSIKGEQVHEIILFPKNLNTAFYKIIVRISLNDNQLKYFKAFGKDGIHYALHFKELKKVNAANEDFTFDTSSYPDITIIDLRD